MMTPASDEASDPRKHGAAEEALRSAAGPGYVREWTLFCDYAAATNQPALPTTLATLAGFFTQLPVRGTTPARRIAAIAAAHRNAGYLLQRPPNTTHSDTRPHPGPLIAACPTQGWPHGLLGRRDAFLITLTQVLGYSHTQARRIHPGDITITTDPTPGTEDTHTGTGDAETVLPNIRGNAVPTTGDPRTCPACAVVRWLDILGIADGLGRGSARMQLAAATAPTALDPHHHTPTDPPRWRHAAQLLPAIDRHGWIDDYQPLSTRSIHTRLTLATRPDDAGPDPQDHSCIAEPETPATRTRTLDEVLTLLDQVADDADALNRRIQALLAADTPQSP
jgi:hypothetical protein